MKKLLFIIPSYHHGGTNRSFCNMIDLFDFESHNISVDLLCLKGDRGEPYYDEIKKRNINILDDNKGILLYFHNGINIFQKILKKLLKNLPFVFWLIYLKSCCYRYKNTYDVVVAMEEGISTYIASFIKTPRKIAWLRCMYDRYRQLNGYRNEQKIYKNIDKIVCVSNACKESICKVYSEFSDKTFCISNTQNRDEIIKKSNCSMDIKMQNDFYNIVSVGRLDIVKQFHIIPEIVKNLIQRNIPVKWYIVGDGIERKVIEERIKDKGVGENVFLLGAKNNPYPFMKAADLIAVTSASESFCNIIDEAKILNKKIITTDFLAAKETMGDYKNGVICDIGAFSEEISCMILNGGLSYNEADSGYNQKIDLFVRSLEDLFL